MAMAMWGMHGSLMHSDLASASGTGRCSCPCACSCLACDAMRCRIEAVHKAVECEGEGAAAGTWSAERGALNMYVQYECHDAILPN